MDSILFVPGPWLNYTASDPMIFAFNLFLFGSNQSLLSPVYNSEFKNTILDLALWGPVTFTLYQLSYSIFHLEQKITRLNHSPSHSSPLDYSKGIIKKKKKVQGICSTQRNFAQRRKKKYLLPRNYHGPSTPLMTIYFKLINLQK